MVGFLSLLHTVRRIDLKKASVARSDTIRNINRQIVLNYVRERSPISRSEISHETALQRSTISIIIDELKSQGFIEEIEGESTGGRPPILLQLRAAEAVAIGINLGTSRTVVATSDLAGRVLKQREFVTDPCLEKTFGRILTLVKSFIEEEKGIEGVGVSLPGLVDTQTGDAIFVPHFKWSNWPITEQLKAATGLPVTVDNDANAAALAELWFGRPEIREVRDFIMVLVAEGLGTGIVFDGQVYHGEFGAAGEFGHMTIGTGAPVQCASGGRECWEAFASERAALARYTKSSATPNGDSKINFVQLVDEALSGNRDAELALIETGHYLGVGISNLIKGLSPQAVIVGGQIARAWPLIEDDLRRSIEVSSICRGLQSAQIIPSTLGENPTLMGALSLVLATKFAFVGLA